MLVSVTVLLEELIYKYKQAWNIPSILERESSFINVRSYNVLRKYGRRGQKGPKKTW